MDIGEFVLLGVFGLIFVLVGFMGSKASWALFPFFGALLSTYFSLALLADGNLMNGTQTLAAANGNLVSDFSALSLIPIFLATTGSLIAIKRALKM